MNNFGSFELQKLATYCYLNPTDERQNESHVLSAIKRLSSSSLRQPNVLFSNIWLKQALQSLAGNELQRSNMYDQTGSLISLNNELSSLEEI